MSPKVGMMVSSYTHSDSRIGNQEIRAGQVAIFGKVSPKGALKAISDVVDRLTKSKDALDGCL